MDLARKEIYKTVKAIEREINNVEAKHKRYIEDIRKERTYLRNEKAKLSQLKQILEGME